ncbi:hypothetical protein [Myroides sp. WP-1]|uniref:hypothetical protein n=1 Tax=Myroides sp. WP-1 TaxID=2759944 RepID=UPI001C71E183|nr:hypothetical protein [Myroides sp. WP-1]
MKRALWGSLLIALGVIVYNQQMYAGQEEVRYDVVARTSSNAKIISIVVKEGDQEEVVVDYDETAWNRTFTGRLPVVVKIKGRALQGNDSSSKLTVQVFKNNELYRNSIAEGANLEVNLAF